MDWHGGAVRRTQRKLEYSVPANAATLHAVCSVLRTHAVQSAQFAALPCVFASDGIIFVTALPSHSDECAEGLYVEGSSVPLQAVTDFRLDQPAS